MDFSRRYAKAADVAGEVIDGEAVIINLATGVYYSMDRVGARCWEALAAGHSPDEVVEAVLAAYGVDRDSAAADIARVVEALLSEGLLTPETAPVPRTPVEFPAGGSRASRSPMSR